MIHIMIGGAGCGKSEYMMQEIRRQAALGETVITLVPEQFSYEYDQKLYQVLGSSLFNQIQTYSFKSLAREIYRQYGTQDSTQTYADDLTKFILLYQAILYTTDEIHALRVLEKQCRQSSFIEEINSLFADFRQNGITPVLLYQSCTSLNGHLLDKTMDLFQIYLQYDHLLTEHHLRDTETDLTETSAIANGQDAFLGNVVFLDEFESFTKDEYEMLDVLLSSCKDVYIALGTESIEQDFSLGLFSSVNQTYHCLKRRASELHIDVDITQFDTPYRFQFVDLSWVSGHIFRQSEVCSQMVTHLHIVEAYSPNEEVDYVCTTIRRLLTDHGNLRCRDIIIVTDQLSAYQSVLETAMERYDLPYHLDMKQSVSYLPLMVYLHTLLELFRIKYLDTELLLRLGKTGLTDCSAMEIAELENYAYIWQVKGKTWEEPFTGGRYETAEYIRKKLVDPLLAFRKTCEGKQSGTVLCQSLYQFLEKAQIQMRLNQQILFIADESQRIKTMEEWTFAWNSWIEIMEHVSELYAQKLLTLPTFCDVLATLLKNVKRAIPPATLDAILVTKGNTARLNSPKIVFLIGACEGVFPQNPTGSIIFSESDCLTLENLNVTVKKSKETQMIDARYSAYKLLSSASHTLYLTYPQYDIAQQKCYPSPVIAQIQKMFPSNSAQTVRCADLGSAYYATTLHAAYYYYIQNYAEYSTEMRSIEQILLEDPFYRSRLRALNEIAKAHEKDADAPLFKIENPAILEQYLGNDLCLSASSLDRYQICPFQYYCNDILYLHQRRRMELSNVEQGNLVHYCLEQLFRMYSREAFLQMDDDTLKHVTQEYARAYWNTSMGGMFSKSKREIASYRHIVADMQNLFQYLQREFQKTPFFPKYTELNISIDQPDFPSMELKTKDGKRVYLIGKVDRVDICQQDEQIWVRVVDYKTGEKKFSLGNLLYGLDMQMLIYLFTILQPHTKLHEGHPAGVLYMPSGGVKSNLPRDGKISPRKKCDMTYRMNGITLQNKEMESIPMEDRDDIVLTEEQLEALRNFVLDALQSTAEQIYAGNIDANPIVMEEEIVENMGEEKGSHCSNCDYSSICGNHDHVHCRLVVEKENEREEHFLQLLEQQAKPIHENEKQPKEGEV